MVFYREQSKKSSGFGVLSSFDIPLLMYGAHTLGPLRNVLTWKFYTGSPKVNLGCFREFEELERCLRYSDLKKFMACACLIIAGRLFQTSGALLVNESMPGREEGQSGRREYGVRLRIDLNLKISY